MSPYLAHAYFVPAASLLPDRVLRGLHRRWPLGQDPADGWSYWMDASYARWCRYDKARRNDSD